MNNEFHHEGQENNNVVFFYTYIKNPVKIENFLNTMLEEEEEYVEVESLANKKWKYYQRASRMLILNEPNKLILGDESEILTGSWEYIEHSNLILFNIVEEKKTKHLIYYIMFACDELLVLSPHSITEAAHLENNYYEIFYSTKKKPTQKAVLEYFDKTKEEDKSIYAGFIFFLITLLILGLYSIFLY